MTEQKPADPTPSGAAADLPGIDFSTLVLSLATSAMVHMGLVPEAEGGALEKNLPLAQVCTSKPSSTSRTSISSRK